MLMALDQRAVDEQVAIVGNLRYLDSFLSGFFRDGGGALGPVISSETVHRCEVSIVRPTTLPGVRYSNYEGIHAYVILY